MRSPQLVVGVGPGSTQSIEQRRDLGELAVVVVRAQELVDLAGM